MPSQEAGPVVSVVVLNWRTESETQRCVDSIRNQATEYQFEIIVVDNQCTETSQRTLNLLPGCRIIPSRNNLGFAAGMNLGASIATGEFLALLNNDLVLGLRWIQESVSYLMARPEVGIVGGKSYYWDPLNPVYCTDNEATTAHWVEPTNGIVSLLASNIEASDVASLDGGSLLLRKNLWTKLGGFDSSYFAYGEDADLCARTLALGYRLAYNPRMEVWHKRNLSSDSVPVRRAFWSRRNHLYNVAKHFPEQTWRRTVVRSSLDDIWYGFWGHLSGLRSPRTPQRLTRSERFGSVAAGLWGITHLNRLRAKRESVKLAGMHDESYVARLQQLNPVVTN